MTVAVLRTERIPNGLGPEDDALASFKMVQDNNQHQCEVNSIEVGIFAITLSFAATGGCVALCLLPWAHFFRLAKLTSAWGQNPT